MADDLHEKVLDILLAHVDYEQDRLRGIADEIVAVVQAQSALEMKRRKMHGTEVEFKDLPVHLQLHSLDKAVRRLDEAVAALRSDLDSRSPGEVMVG